MTGHRSAAIMCAAVILSAPSLLTPPHAQAQLLFGPEQIVQAAGGDLTVPGYSVPSFVDWNNDGLADLVIGDGGGGEPLGKVRVYLNIGSPNAPSFLDYFHAQTGEGDLQCPASGCLGIFPRVVDWNNDERKDMLVGTSGGKVKIHLNINTDADPVFDAGAYLQVGEPGAKIDIHVGARATPSAVDWNSDGKKDLIVGSIAGTVSVFLNEGSDGAPDFIVETWAMADGEFLVVPTARSSPHVCDLDGDGAKDLLSGNTAGQLVFYPNVGTDEDPQFGDYVLAQADGEDIDLPGTPRSRPFVCDWTGDGAPDVIVGSGLGVVHLFEGIQSVYGDITGDGTVDVLDLLFLLGSWGPCPDPPSECPADLNDDGVIDVLDLLIVLAQWT